MLFLVSLLGFQAVPRRIDTRIHPALAKVTSVVNN